MVVFAQLVEHNLVPKEIRITALLVNAGVASSSLVLQCDSFLHSAK